MLSSPAAIRNRAPILEILRQVLANSRDVLEIAAGSGEHALHFARHMPWLTWEPTDPDPVNIASINAYREAACLPNLLPARALDASAPASWQAGERDAMYCSNMLHIAPWAAAIGLFAGAGAHLRPGGRLILYGPFIEADVETCASNLAFDASLRARNPEWGIRARADVTGLAEAAGLAAWGRFAMPANNLVLVFGRPE